MNKGIGLRGQLDQSLNDQKCVFGCQTNNENYFRRLFSLSMDQRLKESVYKTFKLTPKGYLNQSIKNNKNNFIVKQKMEISYIEDVPTCKLFND